jgi:hypothetical protein
MRVSLPALRCLDDESNRPSTSQVERQYTFVFTPPWCGPHQIGIQFPRHDRWGRPILKPPDRRCGPPAGRPGASGELLIVTADNMALLRFIEIEDSRMFQRVG